MTDNVLSSTSTEVLEHECTTLAAQIASATCRFLLVIAELDARKAWGQWWGCKSMAHWLSWRCALSEVTAREHVRVAHALRSLPLTVEAFGRGELSYSKVRALTRVATSKSEAELVDLARVATAAQLDRIIQASIAASTDPDKREAMRELRFGVDDEGFGTARARLLIDQHAIVEAAVAKAVDNAPAGAEAPIAHQRADALVRVCESYLATGDASRAASARNNAVVHIELDEHGVVGGQTDSGVPVHAETCRRLLCDASVQGMLGDVTGPIGCGRQTRTIPRRLRRAINRRSGGGCEWIGCVERSYVEAHHVLHWEHGGPTELPNLVNLCWHHHHLVHEGGWRIEHDGRGRVRCHRPDGTELRGPIPVTAPPFDVELAEDVIVPLWRGERFDLPASVEAVLTFTDRSALPHWPTRR